MLRPVVFRPFRPARRSLLHVCPLYFWSVSTVFLYSTCLLTGYFRGGFLSVRRIVCCDGTWCRNGELRRVCASAPLAFRRSCRDTGECCRPDRKSPPVSWQAPLSVLYRLCRGWSARRMRPIAGLCRRRPLWGRAGAYLRRSYARIDA